MKSAYPVMQEANNGSQENMSIILKQVWNLKVPLNIKHFFVESSIEVFTHKDYFDC